MKDSGHIQSKYANTLKKNRPLNTTLSDDDGKGETDYDEDDDSEYIDNVAFNVVVDMKETTLHDVAYGVTDDDDDELRSNFKTNTISCTLSGKS